jgi:hypothetical protein
MDVTVENVHRIPEHLIVDASEAVQAADLFDCFTEKRTVEEEACSLVTGQIGQMVDRSVIA